MSDQLSLSDLRRSWAWYLAGDTLRVKSLTCVYIISGVNPTGDSSGNEASDLDKDNRLLRICFQGYYVVLVIKRGLILIRRKELPRMIGQMVDSPLDRDSVDM